MADRSAKQVVISPTLLMALSALLWPGIVNSALPPAAEDAPSQKRDGEATEKKVRPANVATADSGEKKESVWAIPTVRFGGTLSYELRRDMTEEQTAMQKGLTATLTATSNTFIWQPWFAQLNGSAGMTMSRNSSDRNETDSHNSISSKSVIMTGNGQLSVLPQSRYPFEAHFDRNDSRASTELAIVNGYVNQRFGFTQHYMRTEGDSMIGWDRNTQSSASNGRDRQDNLQLNLSHNLELQRLQLNGNHSRNTHENTGENAVQSNLAVQHSYAPNSLISVESMANISQSGYHLEQGDNNTRLMQLSSLAFWRPEDKPMTVTAGARMLALAADTTGVAINDNAVGARIHNGNVNVGVNYDVAKFTRLNAIANANLNDINGVRSSNTSQSMSATYQPDSISVGNFRYNWSGSGGASNRTGGQDAGRQLTLQLSHNLSRSFPLGAKSAIGMEAGQSIGVVGNSSTSNSSATSTKQLTHSGSLSWDMAKDSGTALVRLSASDSRSVGGTKEFFQILNLQASSNLPTGGYSSWTGNLTIQAVRQGVANIANTTDPGIAQQNANQKNGFVATSSGSLTYQHQRAFGIRRLRFVSDLRLNSQALLPLLGGPKDQETAGWENRFDYSIGRTQLRLNAMLSRSTAQKNSVDPVTGIEKVEGAKKMNKSIMFSVTRAFGDF